MHALFAGLGSIGRRHLRILRQINTDVKISAYRHDRSVDRVDGIDEYFNLDEALDSSPDIAFITNPTYLHIETAIPCARAGCDLFIEKPLSHTNENIDKLIGIVEREDLVTYIGCQHRFNPIIKKMNELIDENTGVYSFRITSGSYLPDWRPDQDYRESYSADSKKGGGVVLDLIHDIDYTYHLLGEIEDIFSQTGQFSDLEIESEDAAEIILLTSDGAIGSIHLDYFRPIPKRTIEIVCSNKIISGDLNKGNVKFETQQGERTWSFDFGRDDLFRTQMRYFLQHVKSREPCINDIYEGKRVLEIALNARSG